MTVSKRTFEDVPAVRERVPLLIGLYGPSGSGKTYSALRLATGIQRVTGGEIFGIDTEAARMKHYAEYFKFRWVGFAAPFGSLDYLAAIQHCVNKGAGVVIVDSMSHEHEGPGGVLEAHDFEAQRLADLWKTSVGAANLAAWGKPKGERRRLLNEILQMNVNFVFCFRAKEKVKPKERGAKGDAIIQLGWMPIAGEEFVYEMSLNALLLPGSKGVPSWHSEDIGSASVIKLPEQFRAMFEERRPFDENTGEQLAKWAAGGEVKKQSSHAERVASAIAHFESKGVEVARLLNHLGVGSVDELNETDLAALRSMAEKIKTQPIDEVIPKIEREPGSDDA